MLDHCTIPPDTSTLDNPCRTSNALRITSNRGGDRWSPKFSDREQRRRSVGPTEDSCKVSHPGSAGISAGSGSLPCRSRRLFRGAGRAAREREPRFLCLHSFATAGVLFLAV